MAAVSSKLIGVLKSTLEQLEQTEELGADSRALQELRRSILLTIADLELVGLQDSGRACESRVLNEEAVSDAPSRKSEPNWMTVVTES
jgi:hypothetical protein